MTYLASCDWSACKKQRHQEDLTASWREPTRKAGEGLPHEYALIGQEGMALRWKMLGLD